MRVQNSHLCVVRSYDLIEFHGGSADVCAMRWVISPEMDGDVAPLANAVAFSLFCCVDLNFPIGNARVD